MIQRERERFTRNQGILRVLFYYIFKSESEKEMVNVHHFHFTLTGHLITTLLQCSSDLIEVDPRRMQEITRTS
jgi:hypothetical protein